MSLRIKYGPLVYTNTTRINLTGKKCSKGHNYFSCLLKILGYVRNILSIGLISIITLCLFGMITIKTSIIHALLYIYLCITFWAFYEIGYIYNDVYSIKREKKKTNRILDNLDNKFRNIQIVVRVLCGCVLMIPIYALFYNVFVPLVLLILIMLITFSIHNLIRNYSINMYTFIILRILRIALLLIIIINLPILNGNLNDILMPILLFQVLDLFSMWFISYNERLGGKNIEELYGYSYLSMFIFCLLFWVVTKNNFFIIIPLFQLIPRFGGFLYKYPKSFSTKNNR